MLDRERATLALHLPRLLAEGHEGAWVVVQGEEVLGPFALYELALSVGFGRYKLVPFLVEQVLGPDPDRYFGRGP